MSDVAPAKMSRRSSEKLCSGKLYIEERDMQTSNGPGVAGFVGTGLGVAETEAAPSPWRLHSSRDSQPVSEEDGVAACPWQIQSCRKQRRRLELLQGTASDTVEMVKEAAS